MTGKTLDALRVIYDTALNTERAVEYSEFYGYYNRLITEYSERYKVPLINAAIVYGRLSPRTSVKLNTEAFIAVMTGKPKPNGVLTANWRAAIDALSLSEVDAIRYLYSEPLTKVKAFIRNLLLDASVITLDSIMYRFIAGIYGIPNVNALFRRYTEYHSVIYPEVSELDGSLPPYKIQAILWGFARHYLPAVSYKYGGVLL
jgi:hypothetical protein